MSLETIKEPSATTSDRLDVSLDKTGDANEKTIAVLLYQPHPKSHEHFHIELDHTEASRLFLWLTANLEKLSQG